MSAVSQAPQFTTADATRIARDLYGLTATATPLPSERDQNFRLSTVPPVVLPPASTEHSRLGANHVLKIANPSESPAFLDMQNQLLHFLEQALPPATALTFPHVVPTVDNHDIATFDGHHVRLLTWIDGVCLADARPHSNSLLRSLGASLARLANALADFDHSAAHRDFHWDLRHADMARLHLDLLTSPQRRLVEPFLDEGTAINWSTLRTSVVYNDPNDYNVLTDPSHSRIVSFLDFGDVVHSAAISDLAIALAYVILDKADPIAAAVEVVAAYHDVRPLTEAEAGALYTLIATRLSQSVCYAAWQTYHAPDNTYLNITNSEAWALLEKLSVLPAGWPREVFVRVCGYDPAARSAASLAESRRALLGANLSVSYSEPLHIIRGWRQHLYDTTGRAYLDCVNNVAHVGHCHPKVAEAAARQSALLNTNTRYLHENIVEYAERVTATLPAPLRVAFFVCSGSEANELALRLARAHTRTNRTIVVDVAYHGNTNALVEISPYKFNGPGGSGKPAHVEIAPMPDVYRGPHRGPDAGAHYAQSVASIVQQTGPAAFLCEGALGCGGQIILPHGYLKDTFAAVRAAGGVCIADEVQTGFGRAGSHFWMFEDQAVVPDIVTMGKPIGNGHPLGAVVTTPEIARSFANGMEYFNTFGGNPVSCAIGLAVLDVIRDEGLQQHAEDVGIHLLDSLDHLARHHGCIGDVRGLGLFAGIEFVSNPDLRTPDATLASTVVDKMKARGILLSTDGPHHNVIKIKPPLPFNRADVETVIHNLHAVLREAQ